MPCTRSECTSRPSLTARYVETIGAPPTSGDACTSDQTLCRFPRRNNPAVANVPWRPFGWFAGCSVPA